MGAQGWPWTYANGNLAIAWYDWKGFSLTQHLSRSQAIMRTQSDDGNLRTMSSSSISQFYGYLAPSFWKCIEVTNCGSVSIIN